jgi:hypothetical protein
VSKEAIIQAPILNSCNNVATKIQNINDDENIKLMINTELDSQEDPVKQDFLSHGYLELLLIQSGTEFFI